jgi:3-phenylpropionate/trans-cinnamate dioxygenase ferredoxin reductase subunit
LSGGHDATALRGDPASRSFAVFYLQQGRLLAVDAVNSPREFMAGKKLIASRAPVAVEALRDSSVDLAAY